MRRYFRRAALGAILGVFVGTVFVTSGCGSSGASVLWRQIDRAGQPGVEVLLLANSNVINAFNFLSPNGDRFNLDTDATTSIRTEYRRVLTAFAALACDVRALINNANIRPFGRICDPAIDLSTGAVPASFVTWLSTSGPSAGEEHGVFKRFEDAFLPDVIRLDIDVTFANRGVLRYAYDNTLNEGPLICNPGGAGSDRARSYCGGRRFGEDAIRFLYSQIFLGSVGSTQPTLVTVEDDGLAASTVPATFPYLALPQ